MRMAADPEIYNAQKIICAFDLACSIYYCAPVGLEEEVHPAFGILKREEGVRRHSYRGVAPGE